MLCKRPLRISNYEVGCGRCMPCRVNKRNEWTTRLILEGTQHPANSCWFVTLTYGPEALPKGGTLVPRDLKLFLMRLRKDVGVPFRYYAVGEYGEKSWRPHYHALFFGFTDVQLDLKGNLVSPSISRCWPHGFIYIGAFNSSTAAYTAGYICKKLTRKEDEKLQGRHPEFSRMSLKPGIGADAADAIAQAGVTTEAGALRILRGEDVPGVVRVDGRVRPIGRYLKQRVRISGGYSGKCFESTLRRIQIETATRERDSTERERSIRAGHREASEGRAINKVSAHFSKRKI